MIYYGTAFRASHHLATNAGLHVAGHVKSCPMHVMVPKLATETTCTSAGVLLGVLAPTFAGQLTSSLKCPKYGKCPIQWLW